MSGPAVGQWVRWAAVAGAWVVAAGWVWKVLAAARGLPRVPDLLDSKRDVWPVGRPSVTVIVPARNEAAHVGATLRSLLAQDYPEKEDYPGVEVIAVDDRSTDGTAAVMEEVLEERRAAGGRVKLQVLRVTELPEGWLGKTHAIALAARHATTDWLLFTDGDVVFDRAAVRRSLALAEGAGADHLVTVPTMLVKRWDEGMLLGFFQIFGLWAARPWRVEDAEAMRDSVGIGAFNLIRREAYRKVGGFEALRMEILEDVGLGRNVKKAGLAQRVAFGRGLVRVHWAVGALGLVRVMTKNLFSAFRFRVSLLLGACVWLAVFCVGPVMGLFWTPVRVPCAVTLLSVAWAYRMYGSRSGIPAWTVLLFPLGAGLFIFAMLRSMGTTLRDGGVTWRGTFYGLTELRKFAGPLW